MMSLLHFLCAPFAWLGRRIDARFVAALACTAAGLAIAATLIDTSFHFDLAAIQAWLARHPTADVVAMLLRTAAIVIALIVFPLVLISAIASRGRRP